MKKIFFLLFTIACSTTVFPCTTFFINKDGQLIFGRNYDWVTDAGMVCTNLKGLAKTSMQTGDGSTISWVSQFGSISFNQYGKEFPTGGMNEMGLVVELMWLDETKYPTPDKRPAIGVLQWIQYQLDNCSTIEDVIATDKILRIASKGTTPLHYLVADAQGNAATIEFLDGKIIVHKGADLSIPVLTNSIYGESAVAYKNAISNRGNNSLERFNQACTMVQDYRAGKNDMTITDYAFEILSNVAQGNFTKWSIVYDISNKIIRFKTYRYNEVKMLDFSLFSFDCPAISKAWDMNQEGAGDISKNMLDYTPDMNWMLVQTATRESAERVSINDKTKTALWQYASGISCR